MAYDEALAERIRWAMSDRDGVSEQRMFGGLAFLVNGHMALAASGQGGLLLRVDPAAMDSVLAEPGVGRFRMRGRELNGWVHVDASTLGTDEQVSRWAGVGATYAGSLREKPAP